MVCLPGLLLMLGVHEPSLPCIDVPLTLVAFNVDNNRLLGRTTD